MENKYMFVCPDCNSIFPCDSNAGDFCPSCKVQMLPLGFTQEVWRSLSTETRRQAKDRVVPEGTRSDREKDAELQRKKDAGLKFSIAGVRGRSIEVYPYKLLITTDVTLGSVLTHNATDGTKTIYFSDIIGVQYKEPGAAIGYIQFETAANMGNNENSNFFSENTFTYEVLTDEIKEMYQYVMGQLDAYKRRLFLGDGAV